MAWKTYCCFCLLVWFFAAIAVVLKVSSSRNKIVEPKTSPKKQMNEFVFLSWWLRNTWSLNLDFKFQVFLSRQDRKTNLFVCFLGEVTAQHFCFHPDNLEICETWISISSFKYFWVIRIEKQILPFVYGLWLNNFVSRSTDLYHFVKAACCTTTHTYWSWITLIYIQ